MYHLINPHILNSIYNITINTTFFNILYIIEYLPNIKGRRKPSFYHLFTCQHSLCAKTGGQVNVRHFKMFSNPFKSRRANMVILYSLRRQTHPTFDCGGWVIIPNSILIDKFQLKKQYLLLLNLLHTLQIHQV